MTAPSIALQRQVCLQRCREAGVPLFTPQTPQPIREALALVASLVSPRTYAEVRQGTSFYVPKLAGQIWSLIPSVVAEPLRAVNLDLKTTGAIYLAPDAWDKHPCAVTAHELTHAYRDKQVSAGGAIVSSLWALGYVAHDHIRAWEEGTCRVCNLASLVVLEGVGVEDALAACVGGAQSYALGDNAKELYISALYSAAASLRAKQLPGVGNEVHLMAKALVEAGWNPGDWRAALTA